MEFTSENLTKLRSELYQAAKDICDKYHIEISKFKMSYDGYTAFLDAAFENKNDEIERMKFTMECEQYGFTPEDYMAQFVIDGKACEFIGFQKRARKYNCLFRYKKSREIGQATPEYIKELIQKNDKTDKEKQRINNENSKIENSQAKTGNKGQANKQSNDLPEQCPLNEKDLAILNIKLNKSKQKKSDLEQVLEILKGKSVLSFAPNMNTAIVRTVSDVGVENNRIMAYLNKDKLETHLNELSARGMLNGSVDVVVASYEAVIERAQKNHLDVIFDMTDDSRGNHYYYNWRTDSLEVHNI